MRIRLGQELLGLSKIECPSRTLRKSMRLSVGSGLGPDSIGVEVPHYWAPYYIQGRGPIVGKMMIFFPNKTDDPRTGYAQKYPVRVSDIKHLTKKQMRDLKGKYVVAFKVKGFSGIPFFDRAAKQITGADAVAALDDHLTRNVPEVLEVARLG